MSSKRMARLEDSIRRIDYVLSLAEQRRLDPVRLIEKGIRQHDKRHRTRKPVTSKTRAQSHSR